MYQCPVCGEMFDLSSDDYTRLVNNAKEPPTGIGIIKKSCPNNDYTFIVGIEPDMDGWLLFSKELSTTMDEDLAHSLRIIFQHKFSIHPVWGNKDQREALKVFFDLEDEEIDNLDRLVYWISSYGLERASRNL